MVKSGETQGKESFEKRRAFKRGELRSGGIFEEMEDGSGLMFTETRICGKMMMWVTWAGRLGGDDPRRWGIPAGRA